jgi:hypothetical protein
LQCVSAPQRRLNVNESSVSTRDRSSFNETASLPIYSRVQTAVMSSERMYKPAQVETNLGSFQLPGAHIIGRHNILAFYL